MTYAFKNQRTERRARMLTAIAQIEALTHKKRRDRLAQAMAQPIAPHKPVRSPAK